MHLGDIIKNQKFCQSQTFGILTHNVDTSVCGILQKKNTLISGVDKFEAAESVVVEGWWWGMTASQMTVLLLK